MRNYRTLPIERIKLLLEYRADGVLYWKAGIGKRRNEGKIAGSRAPSGYVLIGIDGKIYPAHRIVWCFHHGTWPPMIDHINGNRSDNRIENLRECSPSQNQWNRKAQEGAVSIKGVQYRPDRKKKRYIARINVKGKEHYLGAFETAEAAAEAVIFARNNYHGEFANHG